MPWMYVYLSDPEIITIGICSELAVADSKMLGIPFKKELQPFVPEALQPEPVRQLAFRQRRRMETIFSQLSGQLNVERVFTRSIQGLYTRLSNKILTYNLCFALNSIFGEACELAKIKKLIF